MAGLLKDHRGQMFPICEINFSDHPLHFNGSSVARVGQKNKFHALENIGSLLFSVTHLGNDIKQD
jgi:hypothetical protein